MRSDIKKMVEILESLGIKMAVDACGCCNSPWVYFNYNGEDIVGNSDSSWIEWLDEDLRNHIDDDASRFKTAGIAK